MAPQLAHNVKVGILDVIWAKWSWTTKEVKGRMSTFFIIVKLYYNEVKYVATPALVLIKLGAERTGLRVETEEIKSAWPEGNYDSLMLFWLCHWDFCRGGLEPPPVSQRFRRAILCEVLAAQRLQWGSSPLQHQGQQGSTPVKPTVN